MKRVWVVSSVLALAVALFIIFKSRDNAVVQPTEHVSDEAREADNGLGPAPSSRASPNPIGEDAGTPISGVSQPKTSPAEKSQAEHFETMTDQQFLAFVNEHSFEVKELKAYRNKLAPLSSKSLEYVQNFVGKYRGKMSTSGGYFTIEPAVFNAEAEIEIEKVGEQIFGDVEIKLINKEGRVFSHSQYHGALSSFFSDEKTANPNLFTEDGDQQSASFYHFFLSSTFEQLIGIYYAPGETPNDDYRRVGTLRLNKL